VQGGKKRGVVDNIQQLMVPVGMRRDWFCLLGSLGWRINNVPVKVETNALIVRTCLYEELQLCGFLINMILIWMI
jgi:hypothetical protein